MRQRRHAEAEQCGAPVAAGTHAARCSSSAPMRQRAAGTAGDAHAELRARVVTRVGRVSCVLIAASPGRHTPKTQGGQRRYGGAVGCAYFGRTARRTRVGQEHPSSSSLVGLVRRDSGGGGDDTNKSKTAVQSGARSHFVRRGAGGHAITQRFMHCGGAVVRAYSGRAARRTRAARSGSSSSRGAFLSRDGDKSH